MPVPDPASLLPPWLAERAVALNDRPCTTDRHMVLYWMRVAMRGHDNPALEAALSLAHALDRPLLVYQGLSERYPYASDRHHRFILEGARDVADALARRGIGYAFHLERAGHRGDHLLTLANASAAVVTEIYPWRPLMKWTSTIAKQSGCAVLAVDASCLVPMPTVRAATCDRAFRFRDATAQRRTAALREPMAEPLPAHPGALPGLPMSPLDLASGDLAALIRACDIDHTVAPVPHTPGGTRAGQARWRAFRETGLGSYHRRRNDPLRDGVSRMSPYLHYGQVSPFELAREALEQGGDGASKFLDELLVWRELSWAFCFHHPQHESLAILPDWARSELEAHAGDPRRAGYDWETLARGRTGDALWDAAQRSLLIHGELHNNVRMTWGKMIPQWTTDPATALARLIDLNHRYALDGRDPNSYAGVLWCLGLFDRPFEPAQPVLGRIRGRDTAQHARRLDVAAYKARTRQPALERAPRVAVVGAGCGGLFAGRTLADHGLDVAVFDKGRRPGGRLATRSARATPAHAFDHGAPGFDSSHPTLEPRMEAWAEMGLIARWSPREGGARWVPVPDANALARHLAADLALQLECEVKALERRDGAWWLQQNGKVIAGPFEALLLNLPPMQAARLLASTAQAELTAVATALEAVTMIPCWTAMLSTEAGFDPGFDLLKPGAEPLALACREAAKPGRSDAGCFTFHATPSFSREHLEQTPNAVAERLAPAVSRLLGRHVAASELRCHRWRYARAAAPLMDNFSLPGSGLFLCGDWLSLQGDLEGALLSGAAAAGRLLGEPPVGPPHVQAPEQVILFT
ncbi:MAG: FAD-binding protein [Gammaproteobacteria bacterium]|nr:MAG: FAD-binding protein [Gammaproteobacteria bacterium]